MTLIFLKIVFRRVCGAVGSLVITSVKICC